MPVEQVDAARMPALDATREPPPGQGAGEVSAPTPPGKAPAAKDDDGSIAMEGGAVRASLAARICRSVEPAQSPWPTQPTVRAIKEGFGFLEGPVWVESLSALLFSDMDFSAADERGPPARIHSFKPPATFQDFAAEANSNGLALDNDGSVLACSHDVQSLTRFDPVSARRSSLGLLYQGKRFNSPNDVTVRSDGNMYFTDPDWQLGPRTSETGVTGVYRVSPQGSVTLVTDQLDRPNGIALSLDEQQLYVGSAGNDIMVYPVADDGGVGAGRVFASPGASDGMAVDCAGNLYVTTGRAVVVLGSDGAERARIELPSEPSNVAFGGSDHKTLYITAGPALYATDSNVAGLPF
jgi:gluconolactonase